MCHCAGLCPDQCGLEAGITAGTDMMRAFRCRLQKTLAFRTILGLAEELINKNKDLPFTAAWREVTSIGLP
jgi:hypothetical protein